MIEEYADAVIDNGVRLLKPDEEQNGSVTREEDAPSKAGSRGVEHDVLRRDDLEDDDARIERDTELNDANALNN